MLLVSTMLRPSPIQGLGCFTNVAIIKGEVIWVFDERLDLVVPERELAALPAAARDIVAGEELTCDYHSFDLEAVARLGGGVCAPNL